MNTMHAPTFWHKESYDRFIEAALPELLADRLPLGGYQVERTGPLTCTIHVALGSGDDAVELQWPEIPCPTDEGIFEIDGERRLVLPAASDPDLRNARVRCVGEQLLACIEGKLGAAPETLPWDEALAKCWLPLGTWVDDFLREAPTSQRLDERNWLARATHLRRILLEGEEPEIHPGQLGLVCPFETPEGPNLARVLTIAVGAEIREGRLVRVDEEPGARIGLTASMVPFLEHDDANRLTMGTNMMRQWLPLPGPEPALVQTGNEPAEEGFWCGRNLLTAFISRGAATFEDGILLSESAAERLGHPEHVQVGDKLSNRHGAKGVVSCILPDAEMPHLEDGKPVELVLSFIGCHTRANFGQIREAVVGRIARATGERAIVPPFAAPGDEELRERLRRAGLPESGMERLRTARAGPPFDLPATAGWVYWGVTYHLAAGKLHASVTPHWGTGQGELECYALRDVSAFENVREQFNTRSVRRVDAEDLASRVAEGHVEEPGPPTPAFADVQRRLAAAGIRVQQDEDRLTFRFAPPEEPRLALARAVPHPWLHGAELEAVGRREDVPQYEALAKANEQAKRIISRGAPGSLVQQALDRLSDAARAFCDALLTPEHMHPLERQLFSGRAVLSPGDGLRIDQVGVPDEIAWTLFGPLVKREVGTEDVDGRTEGAAEALDEVMSRSWVVLNRAPTTGPSSVLAFRPVRHPEDVIRLHPLACAPMNADFDGDMAAVLLPLSRAAQEEAAEKLTVAAHLRRDPGLAEKLVPTHESVWGLARLSLSEEGKREIAELAGTDVPMPEGYLTRAALVSALKGVLDREGAEEMLAAAERLLWRGLEAAAASGASISPFFGRAIEAEIRPPADDAATWLACSDELAERMAAHTDFGDPQIGAQVLAVKSGARGRVEHLVNLAGSRGVVEDAAGQPVVVRRGLREGMAPGEAFACVAGARRGLAASLRWVLENAREIRRAGRPKGFNVLARAMRADRPGVVFARAAATGESDPLTDVDARLFYGLPAEGASR